MAFRWRRTGQRRWVEEHRRAEVYCSVFVMDRGREAVQWHAVRYTGATVGGRRAAQDGGPFVSFRQAAAWAEGQVQRPGIVTPGSRRWRQACDAVGKPRWGNW